MAQKIKGTVTNTSAKDFNGRNGMVTLYSFQMDNGKDWYRTGSVKPNFDIGATIEFEYEQNGANKSVVPNSVKTVAASDVRAAPAPKVGKVQENWDARAAYWDAKERREIEVVEPRISLAAARTAAVAVVGLALQHDAIAFGNASKANKLQILLDAVDEVTARYYDQQINAGKKAAPAATPEPATTDDFNDDIPE